MATPTGPWVIPTEHASERILVSASPQQCYAVAADIAAYPQWAHGVVAADVLELDDMGRVLVARFQAEAIGRRARYVLHYDYGDAPHRLGWSQLSGDLTRRVDGAYRFAPSTDDPSATEVAYDLAIDLAVPLPGFVKRRAETKIVEAALVRFRTRAENLSQDLLE